MLHCRGEGSSLSLLLPLLLLLELDQMHVALSAYPACADDSDCFSKPLWRCTALGLKYNYSDGICVQLPPANWENFTLVPCPAGARTLPTAACATTGGVHNCTCMAPPVLPTPVNATPTSKPK